MKLYVCLVSCHLNYLLECLILPTLCIESITIKEIMYNTKNCWKINTNIIVSCTKRYIAIFLKNASIKIIIWILQSLSLLNVACGIIHSNHMKLSQFFSYNTWTNKHVIVMCSKISYINYYSLESKIPALKYRKHTVQCNLLQRCKVRTRKSSKLQMELNQL